jgi:hypothetical protein
MKLIEQNLLYLKQPNRYLKSKSLEGLNPVTVCIAAICDLDQPAPAIVLCADRLVSAGIQFESHTSKIKVMTGYCLAFQSANDSLTADAILEKVREKTAAFDKPAKILDIVELIRIECIAVKKQWIEDNILSKYNITFDKLNAKPEVAVIRAVKEVNCCKYPIKFQFIVAGIEESKQAHLYVIDQDGQYWLQDTLGFATIGSGDYLAFPELTKLGYSRRFPAVVSIPRVYMAKKASERVQGVGRRTDLLILFLENPNGGEFKPRMQELSANKDFMKQLDDKLDEISKLERGKLEELSTAILEFFKPKQAIQPQPKPEGQAPIV